MLVTDKLGTRPCFYTERGGFWFADAVTALLSQHPEPTVDLQAVNDMLLMGHLWGERTLVTGISAMRPATVLEVVDDTLATDRYWKPDYAEAAPGDGYLDELTRRYRQAAARTARTLPSDAGLWLSGGLDSRTTAAALRAAAAESGHGGSLRTFTYNANPPTNDNPRLASRVAARLEVPHTIVPLTAETLATAFERVIDVTDGMIQWNTLINLSATYAISEAPQVMMEGMQGELVGDHPFRYHLDGSSAVMAQYASEAGHGPATVAELLRPDVDPLATFRTEARRSPEDTHRATVLDIHFQNYYTRNTLFSNKIIRDRMGSRVVHADGDYLEWCARLPRAYRKGTFPFTRRFIQADAGGVPLGTSRAKLALCRRIAPATTNVPYERTKVRPAWPYPLHALGFVANVTANRLRGKPTYGAGQLADFWIRDPETRVHACVARLVDDACDRWLFDGDAVRDVFQAHMDGADNAALLAKITTVEYWLQTHLG